MRNLQNDMFYLFVAASFQFVDVGCCVRRRQLDPNTDIFAAALPILWRADPSVRSEITAVRKVDVGHVENDAGVAKV